MPHSLDVLFERLRQFDEVMLLELLDISADDILNRFKDRVLSKRKFLYGEIEVLSIDDDEAKEQEDEGEFGDGYEIVDPRKEFVDLVDTLNQHGSFENDDDS